jgi:hypothetical protein
MNREPSHIAYRRGIVKISGIIVRKMPEDLLPVFARLVILEVQYDRYTDTFKYLAVSPDFDLWNLVEASEPPEYSAEMTIKEGGTRIVSWRKN